MRDSLITNDERQSGLQFRATSFSRDRISSFGKLDEELFICSSNSPGTSISDQAMYEDFVDARRQSYSSSLELGGG